MHMPSGEFVICSDHPTGYKNIKLIKKSGNLITNRTENVFALWSGGAKAIWKSTLDLAETDQTIQHTVVLNLIPATLQYRIPLAPVY